MTLGAHHWLRNQTAVTVATFLGFTSFTLVMPFLPLYFEQLGVHSTRSIAIWSGLSLGVTPAVTAAMAPVWARLAERYGRKLMVARSLVSFMVIMGALAFVQAPWQVFVLRAVQGLFAGYGPIALTMAAESAPPEQMATAIGWVQTAQRLGPALGPMIGGTLAHSVGLRGAFLVSAAVYFAAFLLVLVGYRESGARSDMRAAAPAKVTLAELRAVPHFLLFMGAVFGMQLADRSLGPILPLYLREIGVESGSVAFLAGILFSITAGAAAIGNLSSRWLLTQRSAGVLVAVMAACASAAALVFAAGPPLMVLVGAAACFGLALGVATTSIYTVASRAVPAERRGGAFAYLTSAYLMGLAVSPIVAGFIGSLSMRAVFVADAAGLALVAWLVKRGMVDGAR